MSRSDVEKKLGELARTDEARLAEGVVRYLVRQAGEQGAGGGPQVIP